MWTPNFYLSCPQDLVLSYTWEYIAVFLNSSKIHLSHQLYTHFRLKLTIDNADAHHDADYRCEATKDGKTNTGVFVVDVVMPAICEHEDGSEWEEGTIYNPQETEECTCDQNGEHHCQCIDDGETCDGETPVTWFNDHCVKECVPDFGLCTAAG